MILKCIFLKKLSADDTFKQLLWAVFQMYRKITFFNSSSTTVGAFDLKFAYDLVKAHVCSESCREVFFAIRTNFFSQLAEAQFTQNSTALFTVEWHIWQLEAHDTLELLKSELLLVQIVRILARYTLMILLSARHFGVGLIFEFQFWLRLQLLLRLGHIGILVYPDVLLLPL